MSVTKASFEIKARSYPLAKQFYAKTRPQGGQLSSLLEIKQALQMKGSAEKIAAGRQAIKTFPPPSAVVEGQRGNTYSKLDASVCR